MFRLSKNRSPSSVLYPLLIGVSVAGITTLLVLGSRTALHADGPAPLSAQIGGGTPAAAGNAREYVMALEPSGSALVTGGILVADDELIGSVFFVKDPKPKDPKDPKVPEVSPFLLLQIKLEKLVEDEDKDKNKVKNKDKTSLPEDSGKLLPIQDFEGIASDGAKIVYLVGSHEPKNGKPRPDRQFLIGAEWKPNKEELKFHSVYRGLTGDIKTAFQSIPGGNTPNVLTSLNESLNVEGLALSGKQQLFFGLRAPLVGKKAVLLVASDISSLEKGSSKAMKVSLKGDLVDLGGGGIRSLEWDKDHNCLWIVSGYSPNGELDKVQEEEEKTFACKLWQYDPVTRILTYKYTFLDTDLGTDPKGTVEGITVPNTGKKEEPFIIDAFIDQPKGKSARVVSIKDINPK